jgi:hypothetical protein
MMDRPGGKTMLKLLLPLLICSCSLYIFADTPNFATQNNGQLIVHNRILARVNGKTISVVDVMKKMDVFLSRAYPHLVDSPVARFQFFSTNWKKTLEQMIDNELMIADAEQMELKVSDGDVRENLQERFGPNVMGNLDRMGMTYEEAWDIIRTELIVQRMNWYRIHSKAIQSVNPQDIKTAYKEYCDQNPPETKWVYQVLSIKSSDEVAAAEIATKAHSELIQAGIALPVLADKMKEDAAIDPSFTVSLSSDYDLSEKQISEAHKSVLCNMQPLTYSKPITQKSRIDNSTVTRIFFLKSHSRIEPPAFEKAADKIYEALVEEAVGKETSTYIAKLRDRFNHDEKNLQDKIPADFQPFVMAQ